MDAAISRRRHRSPLQPNTEQVRSTLLASISHDLRTPLAVIVGASSSLAEEGDKLKPEERKALAQSVYRQAGDMSELVAKVLQMTRLDTGFIELRSDWTSVAEITGSVLARLEERLASHLLVVDIPPDLPLVRADSILIEQALANLVENAARHTPAGTVVRVSAKQHGNELVISVEDRGPGIAERDLEQVFAKFHRGGGEHAGTGVGLGLAICRAVVESARRPRMGGTAIRRRRRISLHSAGRQSARSASRIGMTMPRATILIVEDEPEIRRFLRSALGAEDYKVVESSTARRGAIDASTHKPDLVIMDLGLPDFDGVEVIRQIRQWSGMPVLVLSARSQERAKIEALDAGADDYITKPFGVGELLARVRAALRHSARPPTGLAVLAWKTQALTWKHAGHCVVTPKCT